MKKDNIHALTSVDNPKYGQTTRQNMKLNNPKY